MFSEIAPMDVKEYAKKCLRCFEEGTEESKLNWKNICLCIEDYTSIPKHRTLMAMVVGICMNCDEFWDCYIQCLELLAKDGEFANLDTILKFHKFI